MDGFGIQVSYKTAGDTLINVRGEDPIDFDRNLDHVVEKFEELLEAEAKIRKPRETGIPLIERELGGKVLGEIDNSWPAGAQPHPAAWQAPAQPPPGYPGSTSGPPVQGGFQQTHCERCGKAPTCKGCSGPCNPVPKSVKNGEYYIHECRHPDASRDRSHKGQWCNAG